MTRIAFFAHDAADAAVRRRVQGFRDDGLNVVGFTMRRRDDLSPDWENVDLGRTFDGAYAQRIRMIFRGARIAAANRDLLASADLIYARNLDMLATAFLAKCYAKLKTPVVYEALDVHRLLTRKDPIGLIFRRIEGALLSRTRKLVVSSPAFLRNHFERHHRGRYSPALIENRLAPGADYGPRPASLGPVNGPLRLGWVGVLRCRRSVDLLVNVASQLGPKVAIHLHGIPALTEIPDFHARIAGIPNLTFHGRYRSPEDLSAIYSNLDLVWAGDFMEAGFNSLWLLPNRLYEGGYYAVPSIAPAGTETAAWIQARDAGFTTHEPLEQDLPRLLEDLAANRTAIADKRRQLMALPASTFAAPRGELSAMVRSALGQGSAPHAETMRQFETHPLPQAAE